MVVTFVAIDLAANFTSGPGTAMNIHVSCTRANGSNEFGHFASTEPLVSGSHCCRDVRTNIRSRYGSADSRGWCGTRLSSRWSIPQVRAEKHRNAAVDTAVANVDVGLLHRTLEIGVTKGIGYL